MGSCWWMADLLLFMILFLILFVTLSVILFMILFLLFLYQRNWHSTTLGRNLKEGQDVRFCNNQHDPHLMPDYSVQLHIIVLPSQNVLPSALAAQTRPAPKVALRSPHWCGYRLFLGCLGQLFPLPRRRLVSYHTAKEAGDDVVHDSKQFATRLGGCGCTVRTVLGNYTAFTPPNRPSQKSIGQQHWHQEHSQEMGVSSISCSLNSVRMKNLDCRQQNDWCTT